MAGTPSAALAGSALTAPAPAPAPYYILDTEAVQINVVDLQANLVRQFMREGQGPGEFGSNTAAALELAVIWDGRLTVYDLGRMGFTLFGADGEFKRTVLFPGA